MSEAPNQARSETGEEWTTSLPPRRERHKTDRRRRDSLDKRERATSASNDSISRSNKRKLLASEDSDLMEEPNADVSERKHKKADRKGSIIVANVIFIGFLLLVGTILFYTIKYY